MDAPKKISVKAIAIGVVVDIAGTFGSALLLGIVIGIILVFSSVPQGAPLAEASPAVEAVQKTGPLQVISLCLGLVWTLLGGGLAAWIAGRAPVLHGCIVGAIGLLLSVPAVIFLPQDAPLWSRIAGFALTIPAGTFGGYLVKLLSKPSASGMSPHQDKPIVP
ncbi:MAG: hypothetical protein NTX50_30750 [Candidatus Sumerlaeota bacterium]|nr:hypothetical protein [Candidatus Sumerlaeota bacterium]